MKALYTSSELHNSYSTEKTQRYGSWILPVASLKKPANMLIQLRCGNDPRVHWWMNGQRKYKIYLHLIPIQWNITQPWKRRKAAICDNIGGSWGHYAKRGEGNGTPLQCSCLENPRDGGAWWAVVHRVTQSRTRLKWLSSNSSSSSMLSEINHTEKDRHYTDFQSFFLIL